MKTLTLIVILALWAFLSISCTPSALADTSQSELPIIVNTGDDQSVRPDNDRD